MPDTQVLTTELIRALRGRRSQTALSRRLRYRSNVVYLWESGRRAPTPASFFWVAHRTGREVEAALDRFLPERSHDRGDPWTLPGAAGVLQDLRGQHTAAELARHLGCSRHSVARWLRAETEARLPDFLDLVQYCTSGLLDFVALWVDPEELPSVAEAGRRRQAARELGREQPWAPAILLATELSAYRALERHEPGWIARRIGLAPEIEARCIELLAAAGQLERRRGLWQWVEVQSVDTRTPERKLDLKRWWASVGLDRIGERAEGLHSWNLFTVSGADFERIQALQRQYYRAVRQVVEESASKERLVLANLQLVALDSGEQE